MSDNHARAFLQGDEVRVTQPGFDRPEVPEALKNEPATVIAREVERNRLKLRGQYGGCYVIDFANFEKCGGKITRF